MTTIYSHNPHIEVTIKGKQGQSYKLTSLAAYQSVRALANPVAQATITLLGERFQGTGDKRIDGKKIADVVQNNDLCSVTMLDGAGKRHLDIIGTVKIVQPGIAENQGVPANATSILIKGLGQELLDMAVFWHPHIASKNNLGGIGYLARSKGKLPGGRPNEVIENIYSAFLNDDYIFTLPDGRKINQAIQPLFQSFPDSHAKTSIKAMGMEGNLWATLLRFSDAPWGEMHIQPLINEIAVVPGLTPPNSYQDKIGFYLRPTPFDFGKWDALSAEDGWGFDYQSTERMGDGEKLARDESKIYNFFWAPMRSIYAAFDQLSVAYSQSGGLLPIYDEASIKEHGLRRLECPTEYVEMLSDQDQKQGTLTIPQQFQAATKTNNLYEMLAKRTLQLQQWFGYSFFEGQHTTRGRIGPSREHGARIGSVLTRKSDGWQFYVTGLVQRWSAPMGPHMTTWTLERGHDPRAYRKWWAAKQAERKDKLTPRLNLLMREQQGGIGLA